MVFFVAGQNCLVALLKPWRLVAVSAVLLVNMYVLSQGQKRYPKELVRPRLCRKLSGELAGAICLKILVLLGNPLELFRQFFGAVRAFGGGGYWCSFLALDLGTFAMYHWTESDCVQNSETIFNVRNYITFSKINSKRLV